jgi:hypothetical protein
MNSRSDPEWGTRVRPMIRMRLMAGALRSARVAQTWAGPGLDKPCDACDSLIGKEDTEFEIVFSDGLTIRFHVGCHIVWQEERNDEAPDGSTVSEA